MSYRSTWEVAVDEEMIRWTHLSSDELEHAAKILKRLKGSRGTVAYRTRGAMINLIRVQLGQTEGVDTRAIATRFWDGSYTQGYIIPCPEGFMVHPSFGLDEL